MIKILVKVLYTQVKRNIKHFICIYKNSRVCFLFITKMSYSSSQTLPFHTSSGQDNKDKVKLPSTGNRLVSKCKITTGSCNVQNYVTLKSLYYSIIIYCHLQHSFRSQIQTWDLCYFKQWLFLLSHMLLWAVTFVETLLSL